MRLENVTVSFDQRGIAGLHQISLSLRAGELFVIMGANGAGKTTLLRLLSGELHPQSGIVIPADRVAQMDVRSHLTTQGNIQEWLMSGVKRSLNDEQKLQLARDLADAFEFPMQLKKRLHEVSEGQRQRARLAYALVDSPELLLLDEPFAHLDQPLRFDLMRLLKSYVQSREITVAWVTHHREEALSMATRLGVLSFGRWEQMGTPEEVYWRPKSLVVAQLMGHKNLVTVTRSNPQEAFQTPFGTWSPQGVAYGKTHTVLSLPPEAFELHPQGVFAGSVIETRFMGHLSEVILENAGQQWTIRFKGPQLDLVKPGEIRRFNVDLSQGVGIDCL